MRLHTIAHSRAGDKGDISDLSLIAYHEEDYEFLAEHVTAERVKAHFADIVNGPVERYEVPALHALKFVLHGALGGGVTRSLNQDIHGKSLSSALLELEIPDRGAQEHFGRPRELQQAETAPESLPKREEPAEVLGSGRSLEQPVVRAPAAAYLGTASEAGLAVFAGIPFAEPPVGALRFRPPKPPADTAATIDATRFRAAPAQRGSALALSEEGGDEQARAWGAVGFETSEDCLYLNVWTPDVDGSRPVLVWIYGGGFDTGSAAPPMTDGGALSRLTDTVVVSLNYRVGALGFGYWRGIGGQEWADSSNLGLQDQAAALAWVRRNIAAFGGDATRITVAGESAGAFSIGSLLAMPAARASFDRAILQSGNVGRLFPTDTAEGIARDLMALLEIETMEELQQVAVDRILDVQSRVIDTDLGMRNLPGGRSWGVVLDGDVLARPAIDAIRAGDVADVPLLMGANRDEARPFQTMLGAAWAPASEDALLEEIQRAGVPDPSAVLHAYVEAARNAGADPGLASLRTAFLSDAIYRRPVFETAVAHRAAAGHAWTLLFSAAPFGSSFGAGHGMDVLYTFDMLAERGLATEEHVATQRAYLDAWKRFAYTGDPGWSEYDYRAPNSTRQFGGDTEFVSEPAFDAIRRAWPVTGARPA